MMVAVGALVLVHNLYTMSAPEARWGIRLSLAALTAMWTYDLNLYTFSYLTKGDVPELYAMRGCAMAVLVPVFALGAHRNASWKLRLSRTITFQSLSLVAIGAYLIAMRSEEHTSELQSLMRSSYAVFCLKKKNVNTDNIYHDVNAKT